MHYGTLTHTEMHYGTLTHTEMHYGTHTDSFQDKNVHIKECYNKGNLQAHDGSDEEGDHSPVDC